MRGCGGARQFSFGINLQKTMKTNSKEVKQAIQAYILGAIDFQCAGYDESYTNDVKKFLQVKNIYAAGSLTETHIIVKE